MGKLLLPFGVKHGDEVSSVVDDVVRIKVQNRIQVMIVLLGRFPLLGEGLDAVFFFKCQRHRVISG